MVFDGFMRTLHGVIGNKALYEFTVELFDSSTDESLFLTPDTAKNWFSKRNQGYMKNLNVDNFNAIKFNTYLKARTMGAWRTLQSTFRSVNVDNPECLINFVTDNHDKFLESIEWQFKAILRIPIVVDSDIDNLTLAVNSDDGQIVEYVDISGSLFVERCKDIVIREKWIVLTELHLETLTLKHFPEIVRHGVGKGIEYKYFLCGVSADHVDAFKLEFFKFTREFEIVALPDNPSDRDFLHIPKWGYIFYFTDEQDKCRGYMFNKFHDMKAYNAFRMNEEDAGEIINRLRGFLS